MAAGSTSITRGCYWSFKQGKDACDARILPKDKLERLVIKQIKDKILAEECLVELVKLVNEELDSTHSLLRERLDTIDAELGDVKARLSKHGKQQSVEVLPIVTLWWS